MLGTSCGIVSPTAVLILVFSCPLYLLLDIVPPPRGGGCPAQPGVDVSKKNPTYFDRMLAIGLGGSFGALKVNADRGTSMFKGLALISWGLTDSGPATIPSPVSTKACPREPALDPNNGISFRA